MARSRVPLHERANLSLAEAMRFARIGHGAAKERLVTGRWLWFWEGKRKRIITSSIIEDQERQARQQQRRIS